LLVGEEHHSKLAQHEVELVVRKGQILGIGLLKGYPFRRDKL
jgi:hypothetical protein